jgi:hypothetical protein
MRKPFTAFSPVGFLLPRSLINQKQLHGVAVARKQEGGHRADLPGVFDGAPF